MIADGLLVVQGERARKNHSKFKPKRFRTLNQVVGSRLPLILKPNYLGCDDGSRDVLLLNLYSSWKEI